MTFALVLLAYNRPQHLERTLNRLRQIGAFEAALTVEAFLDGPKSPTNEQGVDACAALLEQLKDEVPLVLHQHRENRGLGGIINDLDQVFARNNRVAVVEDGVLLEPAALGLLSEGWAWIDDLPDVMSIGFYQAVPFPLISQGFFRSARFTCWGWMSTSQKWSIVRGTSLNSGRKLARKPEVRDIAGLIHAGRIAEGRSSWDYVVASQMLAAGMTQIVPRHSLSSNSDMTGGVHGSDSFLHHFHAAKLHTSSELNASLMRQPKGPSWWYKNYMRLLTHSEG